VELRNFATAIAVSTVNVSHSDPIDAPARITPCEIIVKYVSGSR